MLFARYLSALLLGIACCQIASATTIEFENDSTLTNFGTYSEAGYTFVQSHFQTNIEDPGAGDDGRLAFRTFTNGRPSVRMTNDAAELFDLLSLDVDEFAITATFEVIASSGATHPLTSTGNVDFSLIPGDWTNLTHVDFQYSGPSSSESITLDNIQVRPTVPEPTAITLGLLATLAMLRRRC